MDTNVTNERCEVCRRRDAAILDDNRRAYCPHCWWAYCEGVIGGRRLVPRRATLPPCACPPCSDLAEEGERFCRACDDYGCKAEVPGNG